MTDTGCNNNFSFAHLFVSESDGTRRIHLLRNSLAGRDVREGLGLLRYTMAATRLFEAVQ
jgi:hypothetical protein